MTTSQPPGTTRRRIRSRLASAVLALAALTQVLALAPVSAGPTGADPSTPSSASAADEVAATVVSNGGFAQSPAIAASGTDSYVAFTEDGPGVQVVAVRDEGASIGAPTTLTVEHPARSQVGEPAVAAAGGGAYVAWDQQPRDGSDGEVYIATSPDRGATWNTHAIGAPTTRSATAVKVAASESLVVVTYRETYTGQVVAVTSVDGGATFQRQTLGRLGWDHDLAVSGAAFHVAYAGDADLFVFTGFHSDPGRHVAAGPAPIGIWNEPDIDAIGHRVHVGYTRRNGTPGSTEPEPMTHHIASSLDAGKTWATTQVHDEAGSCPISGLCHPIDIAVSSTRVHGAFLGQDRQVYEVLSVDESFVNFDTVVHASAPHHGDPDIAASDSGVVVTWDNHGSPLVADDAGVKTIDVFESVRQAHQRTPSSMSWTSDPFQSYGAVTAPTGSTYGMAWVRLVTGGSGARSEVAFRQSSIGTADLEIIDVRAVQASVVAERLASGKETVLRARLRNGVSLPSTFTIRWTYDAETSAGPVRRVEDQRVTLAPGVRNVVFHPKQSLYVQEGDLTVHAEVDLANEVEESDEQNNESSRTQEVVGVEGLSVLYVPLDVAGEEDVDCLNSVRLAAGRTSKFLEQAMPVDSLALDHQASCFASLDVPFPSGRAYSGMLFTFLAMQKQLTWGDVDLVVAVAPDGFFERRTFDATEAVAAAVYDGHWGVVVVEEQAVGGWVIAHELAHDRGWVTPEASRGKVHHLEDELAPGYNVAQKRQIDLLDFMSPKADVDPTQLTRWIGPRSWDFLLDSFRKQPGVAEAASATDGEVVALAGVVQPDGTVQAAPPQVADGVPTADSSGDVTVRFLDAGGAELGRGGMDLHEVAGLGDEHAHAEAVTTGAFRGTVSVPDGTSALTVETGGQERFRALRSANAPTVDITSATEPITLEAGDAVPLTFTTADADGDDVTAHVEHSTDGATWVPSAEELVVGREHMGHDVRYRVVATDGWHRTVVDALTVTVDRPLADGELAQVVDVQGRSELFTTNPDGSALEPLVTGDPLGALWPEWRPDGERIAFTADGEIVTVAADGSDRRSLGLREYFLARGWRFANASCPTWSPDGTQLAVTVMGGIPTGSADPSAGIWIVDPRGVEEPRLVRAGDTGGRCGVDWAADGLIWFLTPGARDNEVFSMRTDGTEVVRRIANPSPGNVTIWSLDVDPSAQLVLTTENDRRSIPGGFTPAYVTKVDGSGRRLLTDLENRDHDALYQPSWSPTGSHVWAFHWDAKEDDTEDLERRGLVRIDPFSGDRTYLHRYASHPQQRPVPADRAPEVPDLLARVSAPGTTPEGGTATFDASDTTAEAGIAGVGWDVDADGVEDETGTSIQLPAVDDGPLEVTAVATDDAGQQMGATASTTVTNVAPTITSATAAADGRHPVELTVIAEDPGTLDELVADITVDGVTFGQRRLIEVDGMHRLDADLPPDALAISVSVRDDDGGEVETSLVPDYVERTGSAQAKAASATAPAGAPVVFDDVVVPAEGRTAWVRVVTPPAVGTVDVLAGEGVLGGPALRYTSPVDAAPGEVTFEVVALGDSGEPEGDAVTMAVTLTATPSGPDPEPPTPTVNAGPDVEGTEGAPIPLDGSGADLADAELRWTVPAGCTVADATAASTTVTCADDVTGVAVLDAVQGTEVVASDDAVMTVANIAPTVAIQRPAPGLVTAVGQEVAIDATATDTPADPVVVTIDPGDGSTPTVGTSRRHAWAKAGTYTVTVTADDGDGGRSTATTTVVVEDPATATGARVLGAGLFRNGALVLWARDPKAPAGHAAGMVAGRTFEARVATLGVSGTTATVTATGRWGTVAGVRVEITVTDGGTRPTSDQVRVVVKDGTGRTLADSGRQTVIGGFAVRSR